MHKFLQNASYNGGPAAALEGILYGGLDVRLEWAP